ncbi:MAG: hypothetical protein HQK67_04915 [Desulfamplus sp.]|nr:hypothetical protein [Desulfamplus sp.]
MDEYTMLNYLHIEAKSTPIDPPDPQLDINKPDNYIILNDSTVNGHIGKASSGFVTHLFGTSGINNVSIEKGAWAKLINFPGSNMITIESDSKLFSISRSGATVTLKASDNTLLVLPATKSRQTILFTSDNKSLELFIESNSVMLGNEIVQPLSE